MKSPSHNRVQANVINAQFPGLKLQNFSFKMFYHNPGMNKMLKIVRMYFQAIE